MDTAITICNSNSLAFCLSKNPISSHKYAPKFASLSSLLPNQLLNCSTLSSSSLTKKVSLSHVQQRSIQCSAAGITTTPSGNSFLYQFVTLVVLIDLYLHVEIKLSYWRFWYIGELVYSCILELFESGLSQVVYSCIFCWMEMGLLCWVDTIFIILLS